MAKKQFPIRALDDAGIALTSALAAAVAEPHKEEITKQLRHAIYHLTLARLWHTCPDAMKHAVTITGNPEPPDRFLPTPPLPKSDRLPAANGAGR